MHACMHVCMYVCLCGHDGSCNRLTLDREYNPCEGMVYLLQRLDRFTEARAREHAAGQLIKHERSNGITGSLAEGHFSTLT